jgi:hypothetical protein
MEQEWGMTSRRGHGWGGSRRYYERGAAPTTMRELRNLTEYITVFAGLKKITDSLQRPGRMLELVQSFTVVHSSSNIFVPISKHNDCSIAARS